MRLTEAPVLPPLPPREYDRLRESIRERGGPQCGPDCRAAASRTGRRRPGRRGPAAYPQHEAHRSRSPGIPGTDRPGNALGLQDSRPQLPRAGQPAHPESVQLVVTDPPWLGEYEEFRQPIAETILRILKPGGFACVYSAHFNLKEILDVLCGAGLTHRWLVACTHEESMGAVRSGGSILTLWRPVLLFQKPGGRHKTPRILRDLIGSGATRKIEPPVAAADRRGDAVREDALRTR